MREMTPRERFYTTVDNKEPDRVPIQLGGLATSIANYQWGKTSKYGYDAFCRYVGLDKCKEPVGIWGIFNLDPKIIERAHSDFDVVAIGDYPPKDMGSGQKKFKEFGLKLHQIKHESFTEKTMTAWAHRKYKKLRRHRRRAEHWLGRIARCESQ